MKFLVTGGAGFIGHNVIHQLEAQGHECFVIDNQTTYGFIPKDELKYLVRERRKHMRALPHAVDIRDYKKLEGFFTTFGFNADAVIHLASFPRQKVVLDNPILGSEVMTTGLINLLELTKKYRIPKFVYISSSMVYGDFKNDVHEHVTCNPVGQYAIMKYMGEKLVKDYTRRGCFDHVIVRPSAVYGERDVEDRVVSKFILSALRGETLHVKGAKEILDFTHVSDTAQGIALASTLESAVGQTYNITRCDRNLHTLLDAANQIVDIVGAGIVSVEDRDVNFPKRGRLDIMKARTDLAYDPQVNLTEGLLRYVKWFKESTYWQQHL